MNYRHYVQQKSSLAYAMFDHGKSSRTCLTSAI